MVLAMAPQVWAQPSGMGKGGLMGAGGTRPNGRGWRGRSRTRAEAGVARPLHVSISTKATTITGQVESLGSYRLGRSWRSLPGMAVQGLILKTEHGNIEVYLGPPSYVARQKFMLLKGDTLEVNGFKVLREHQAAFFAAKVKKNNQTLNLLDEDGSPLWKQQDTGGPGTQKSRPRR